MSAGAAAPQHIAVDWRQGRLPFDRHGVGVAGDRRTAWADPASCGPPGCNPTGRAPTTAPAGAELGLQQVGEVLLGVALGADVDEPGGQRRGGRIIKPGRQPLDRRRRHRVAPWSRSTSLSALLSWRSPSSSCLTSSTHGSPNSWPPGKRTGAAGGDRHGPWRDHAPPDLVAAPGLDHRDRSGEDAPGPEHDAVAHPGAVGDDAAAADQARVADHDRRRARRLEHAADADPAREVDVPADLGAAPNRGPRVDHGVGADPGADVDVARHHDRRPARGAPPSGRWRRGRPGHRRRLIAPLERDLVGVLERPDLDGRHPRQAEEQQDGQLEPLVDDDLAVDHLGDPASPRIEQVDGLVHGRSGGLVVTGASWSRPSHSASICAGEVGHGRRGYKRGRFAADRPGRARSALHELLGHEHGVAPLRGADAHLGEVGVEQVLAVGRRRLERGLGLPGSSPAMATFSPISCQPGLTPDGSDAEWKIVPALAMRCGLGLRLQVELVATAAAGVMAWPPAAG